MELYQWYVKWKIKYQDNMHNMIIYIKVYIRCINNSSLISMYIYTQWCIGVVWILKKNVLIHVYGLNFEMNILTGRL